MTSLSLAALKGVHSRFDEYPWFDRMMRVPIVGYSLAVLAFDVLAFCWQVAAHPDVFRDPDGGVVAATLARVSQWEFILLLAILPVFRFRPIAKSGSLLPRIGALAAAGVPPFFMLLERAPPSLAFNLAAVMISLVANVMAVVTVSFLGRSLSVMPEARRLVTSGPYALTRHPLYLCEILGVVAIVLQYRSLLVAAIFVLVIALQAARGQWEEEVLARAFSEFSAYRARTPFLIPRDPARFVAAFFVDSAVRRRSLLVIGATLALQAFVLTVLPRVVG
jgi:protein-S-isoprenylcysteine O-methyltransferase Ste14